MCDIAGDFRHSTPTAISFAEDGSLLAISFQDTVTLWDPMTSNLKTTLAHSLFDQPIRWVVTSLFAGPSALSPQLIESIQMSNVRFMEFGRDQCFRYLVCATEHSIVAWDVITHGLIWKVADLSSPVVSLTADPKSMYMAVVLQNSEGNSIKLICFGFHLYSKSLLSLLYSFRVCAVELQTRLPRGGFEYASRLGRFRPASKSSRQRPWMAGQFASIFSWCESSKRFIPLHLLVHNWSLYHVFPCKELYRLDDQLSNSINKKVTSGVSYMDNLPWTPFTAMKAQQKISNAKKTTAIVHDTKGILGYESIQTVGCCLFLRK